jgi:hypothetical protein
MSLITTVDQLKQYLGGLQKNINAATILPFVDQAEAKYLTEAIGPEMLEQLAGGGLGTFEEQLFGNLQRSLAFYTVLEAAPFLLIQMGDAGFGEIGNGNTQPLRQWVANKMEIAAFQNGDAFLDQALQFMEDNAAQFPIWTASDSYTINRELFITSTRELSKIISIRNSRRTFLMLRPFIDRAETIYFRSLLGEAFFAELKTQLASDSLTTDNRDLVNRLNKALGNLALVEALPEISVQISANGIRVLVDNDGIQQKLTASRVDVEALRANSERVGKMYLADFTSYLLGNAEAKFPTYFNSDTYQASLDKPRYQRPDNCNSPTFTV